MIDWTKAPSDAVCYAYSAFRNLDGFWWDNGTQCWNSGSYSMVELKTAADYEHKPITVKPTGDSGTIKSDGGSSSYYDIPLPDWLIDLIVERRYIKTEELIEVLGGDFDEANILKCLVRINSLRNGKGKEGNTVDYDCNKISYSANRIKEVESR